MLIEASVWLDDEEARVKNYLHELTRKVLVSTSEKVLLSDHSTLMQEQFRPLLERHKIEDLTRMFSLLNRVPETLGILRDYFENHVREEGLLEISKMGASSSSSNSGIHTPEEDQKKKDSDVDPQVYVQVLLSVHAKFESVVQTAFCNEPGFVASLDKGCRDFVNRNILCKNGSSRSSELLAKYTDGILRKSSKVNEDTESENLLNGVVIFSLN
jgi:cullin 1